MFDNNRTFKQRAPTQSKSVVQQAGQLGGQFARSSVGGIAKMANTAAVQVPQAYYTGTQALAARTNNTKAYENATRNLQATESMFNRNKGGLLNAGTLYNTQEAQQGSLNTGLKRVGGGTLQGMAEAYTLGKGAPVGASIMELGLKKGLIAVAPELAKTFSGNVAQGAITAANQGASAKDVFKSAALSGVLGSAGDIGLGVAGAAVHPIVTGTAGKVYGAVKPKVNIKPLDQSGSVRLPFTKGQPGDTLLDVKNPLGAKVTKQLDINNPLGAKTGLEVNNPLGARQSKVTVKNNTGAPLKGEGLSGAAQQSYLAKNGGLTNDFNSPEVRTRMMKDYLEGKPPVKGSALSGEGAKLPSNVPLSPLTRAKAIAEARAKARAKVGNTDPLDSLKQEARKYKSAELTDGKTYIKDGYADPKDVLVVADAKRLQELGNKSRANFGAKDQVTRLDSGDKLSRFEDFYKNNNRIKAPALATRSDGSIAGFEGNHRLRVLSDKNNGKVVVSVSPESIDVLKKQGVVTDLYNQANKPKVGFKKMDQVGGGATGDSEVLNALRKVKAPKDTNVEVKNGLGTQLKTAFIEKDQPIIGVLKQLEKKTGKKGLVDQFMYDSGLVSRSDSIANAKLANNPNLKAAFDGLSKKELNRFNEYSSARSELYNASRGLPTTRPVPELQATVDSLSDNAPRFDSLNKFYKDYAKDLLDGGIISPEKYNQFISSPDYVRTQRDMADLIGFKNGSGGGYSLKSTLTNQKRVGSSKREILPADRTAFDYAQKTQAEIQRNQASTNLIDMLEGTDLIRKINKGEKVGGKNTVARFVNGVQEQFEVSPEIKQAVDHLAPYQLGLLQKIVSAPKRIFQAGTTGLSAPFTIANYVKDQIGSGINSKSIIDTHNPVNIMKGLYEASKDFGGAKNSEAWNRFLAHSGDTTQFDLLRGEKNAAQLSRELRMGGVGKTINRVLSPIKTLEDAVSITEKATRYQNYLGMENKLLSEGATKPKALQEATLAAWQNSTDFNRYGDWAKTINLLVPYFNSGIQGTRQLTRAFKTRPVATTIKTMATVGMPLLSSTAYNLSDPERKKVYDNISEFEKENNFILIPPNSKQNKDGTYDVYKLPMPFGYSNLMGPARRAMVSFANNSPQDWAKISTDIMGAFSGPINTNSPQQAVAGLIPQAIKPLVQQAANKDFFTGKDIVPEYVNKATDAQGNPVPENKKALSYTSGSAQIIGNLSGQSPIRVEKFFKDTFGKIGQYGVNTVDNTLAKLGIIKDSQIGGVSAMDDISRRFTKAQGNYNYEKSAGGKYYDAVKEATKGLDANEQAAYSTLHPSKSNFLGEDIFDENKRLTKYARAGIYLQFPDVYQADKRLNDIQAKQGNPSNPLYELAPEQLTRVLLKATLPPGSKDPELSALYQQDWYQDYNAKRSKYYDQIKNKMAKEGKTLPPSDNPYPETPKNIQKLMDTYSSLPKGTGARSAWIRANPTAFKSMTNQWAAVDAWENKERLALGLSEIANDTQTSTYGNSSGSSGGGGGRTASSYYGKSKSSVKGKVSTPSIKGKTPVKLKGSVKTVATSKPKVTIKKSLV